MVQNKILEEVISFSNVFWERYSELRNGEQFVRRILAAEEKRKEGKELSKLLKWKFKGFSGL